MILQKKHLLTIALASMTFTQIVGCGKSTDLDLIGDAQACLDNITTGNDSTGIAACKAKVASVSSSSADGIRCSANFMREGFTNPSDIATKLSDLNNGNTTNLMGAITFTTGANLAADVSNATSTFQYCYNSGGKGATILAAFAYIPMALIEAGANGGNSSCNKQSTAPYYNFSTCLQDAVIGNDLNATSLRTAIGQVVIATYTVSCSNSSSNATLCSTLLSAINSGGGTSNPAGVGQALIVDLATN